MYMVTPNPPIYNGLFVVVTILLHSVLGVTYDHSRISIMDIVQYHTPHSILAAHPDVLFGFIHFYSHYSTFSGLRKITVKQSRCSRSTVLIFIPVTCLLRDFRPSCGLAHDDAVDAEYRYGGFCCELNGPLFCS